MRECDFNKVGKQGSSPVNLLQNFRTPFSKNTSGWLLLSLLFLCETISAFSFHNR